MSKYAHMCRDGHVEIGHNDSSSELCPLCRMTNERDAQLDISANMGVVVIERGKEIDRLTTLLSQSEEKRLILSDEVRASRLYDAEDTPYCDELVGPCTCVACQRAIAEAAARVRTDTAQALSESPNQKD